MNYKDEVLKRLREHKNEVVEKLYNIGLKWGEDFYIEAIYLQGSQNYNTHHEGSDVDSKMVIVPSIRSVLMGCKLNYDFDLENGEKCSVKPVMDFVDLFWKGNINNLEILTTEYKIGEENSFIEWLIYNGYAVAIPKMVEGTLWDASIGMMIQKQKSLFKGTETTKPYVEKHGFDGKDLTHIIRIHEMLHNLAERKPFQEALNFKESLAFSMVKMIREGGVYMHEAQDAAEALVNSAKHLQHKFSPRNVDNLQAQKDAMREKYVNYYMENYL